MVKIHKDEIVSLSVEKMIKNNFSVENYFIAYMVHIKNRWLLQEYFKANNMDFKDSCADLLAEEYLALKHDHVGLTINNLVSTEKMHELFDNKGTIEDPSDWIDEWYALWPVGIRSGGYYIRTDKAGTLRKMKDFILFHPQYDKEMIMQATKNYLLDQSIRGYSHCKLAPYFIAKDGMSILAGECENLEDEPQVTHIQSFGQDEL